MGWVPLSRRAAAMRSRSRSCAITSAREASDRLACALMRRRARTASFGRGTTTLQFRGRQWASVSPRSAARSTTARADDALKHLAFLRRDAHTTHDARRALHGRHRSARRLRISREADRRHGPHEARGGVDRLATKIAYLTEDNPGNSLLPVHPARRERPAGQLRGRRRLQARASSAAERGCAGPC